MRVFVLLFFLFFSCNKIDKIPTYNYFKLTEQEKGLKAIEIAEIEWNKSYGKAMMDKEKPLIVEKINDSIYSVRGSFNNKGIGGVAFGKVDVKNNKIIEYSHGE